MKNSTPELRALLASGTFLRADLYTLELVDGTVIRTTSADIDLTWGADTFLSDKPILTRDKITSTLGLEVDSLAVVVSPRPTDLISGLAYGAAIAAGALDGATFLLQKAYLSAWPTVVGVLHGFEGKVSDIDGTRGEYKIEVKSDLELLNIDMPRNVYQGPCLHSLYGPGCTVNRAEYTESGTVTGGNRNVIQFSMMAFPDGYFDQGVVIFSSGPLAGTRRTIRSHTSAGIEVSLPWPVAPLAGQTFTLYPGCNKTMDTCIAKFDNLSHFKGFPFIPSPETAL